MAGPDQRELLAQFQKISQDRLNQYADRWQSGEISLAQYELLFKSELRDIYLAAGWCARGATDLSFSDYGKIGRRLRDQYGYMHGFFTEISQGEMSLAQIKARGQMYASSSSQTLEEVGNSELPLLPAYPGDGSTTCRANCKCSIDAVPVENGFDVHWRLSAAEHCEGCVARSSRVLMVRFGKVINPEVWG